MDFYFYCLNCPAEGLLRMVMLIFVFCLVHILIPEACLRILIWMAFFTCARARRSKKLPCK